MVQSLFSRLFLLFVFFFCLLSSVAAALSASATILVIASDSTSAFEATEPLNGYGIPTSTLLIPQAGTALPALSTNSSSGETGNYGGIVIVGQVAYDYGGTEGYQSALTTEQWNVLYAYQLTFGVRMVQLDVYPGPAFGATAQGGCCDSDVEQLVYVSDDSAFKQAGLVVGATVGTDGLWHYPSTITDTSTTKEFLAFGPGGTFTSNSTAGVINNFDGRQQMATFIGSGYAWSQTSNFIAHTWIPWVTRGLYVGYRRTYLNTQVDDMFLETDIYYPSGTTYRVSVADMTKIASWIPTIIAKMPEGSSWFLDVGFNGNGNIEASDNADDTGELCQPGPIEYSEQIDTDPEFQKPLGTGTDIWPESPTVYEYSVACTRNDPLMIWWQVPENRDLFAIVSHTFTHEQLNNATYADAAKEIQFNQAWLNRTGLSQGKHVSLSGLIPPAITGLHNGDVIKAWVDNGLRNGVGDNTRSPLLNTQNSHWPLITNFANNGYAGFQITPRWATNIYYNCVVYNCTVAEWIDTATPTPSGDFNTILEIERTANTRHLLGLHHDPFMFHQANLGSAIADPWTVNGVTKKWALIQIWMELIVAEMTRLVNWPLISLKHDDIASSFAARMARDSCVPKMSYTLSGNSTNAASITGFTVSANGNSCSAEIPVTVPGPVTNTQGFPTEQIGNDPLTIWVKMAGQPVSFTLSSPITL